MNCDQYREAITADPSESFDGASLHIAECASCVKYRDEIRLLDDKIAAALAINVPDLKIPVLPPASENSNVVSLTLSRTGRLSAPAWIGIAASVAIAAVLGVRFLAEAPVYDSLGDEVLAHLDHEPSAFRNVTDPVSERRLDDVVRSDIASMDRNIGLITYAMTCVINGHEVPHLVIQGENGPVTLLLLPEEHLDAAVELSGENINGIILPVGSGSIAIIGAQDENLRKLEKRVVDSVEWRI
jgi:hypothetical protein